MADSTKFPELNKIEIDLILNLVAPAIDAGQTLGITTIVDHFESIKNKLNAQRIEIN